MRSKTFPFFALQLAARMSSPPEKQFIGAQDFLEDSVRLAFKILQTDYRPKFVVGIWRGGSLPGITVQEILKYSGFETDHISIRTSSYVGTEQSKVVRVHGLEYIVNNISHTDDLLIVDDVFETGKSVNAVISKLKAKCRRNMPEVKVATVYYKPHRNVQTFKPNFWVHTSDRWLVFPHEFEGLTKEEIRVNKGFDPKEWDF